MSNDGEKSAGCGCTSVTSLVIAVIVLWAVVFGVTIDGKHYGLSCSAERGVEIQSGEPVVPDEPK